MLRKNDCHRRKQGGSGRGAAGSREDPLQYFDFEVLQGDVVIACERAVALDDSRAAWPMIVGIARTLRAPNCRIRVREQEGDTIILIGATAARLFPVQAEATGPAPCDGGRVVHGEILSASTSTRMISS